MQARPSASTNYWLKLFSVVLASLIWFVVDSDLKNSRTIEPPIFRDADEFSVSNVPVAVLTSPGDQRVFTVVPPRVEVTLRSKAGVPLRAQPGEVRVFVDMSGNKEPSAAETLRLVAPAEFTPLRATPPVVIVSEIKR